MRLSALVVAACAIGRTAVAADVSIAVDQAVIVAPATVILSAKTRGDEVIVSHRWTGLPNAPRCRDEECIVDLPVASCTAVELEVVDLNGHTTTATRALCANDPDGGVPPSIFLAVEGGRASVQITEGSDAIALQRTWLDGVENTFNLLNFPVEQSGGCHAIDAFAVDRRGRIAIAQKSVCFEALAPELWVGGMPSTFVPIGERIELCVDVAHPLGLEMMRTAGDAELDACGAGEAPPLSLVRAFVSAVDSEGVESSASAFLAAVPDGGTPVLFFAEADARVSVEQNKELRIDVSLYGGTAPFSTSLPNARVQGGSVNALTLVLTRASFPIGDVPLAFTIRDARGLEAEATTLLTVTTPIFQEPGPGVQAQGGAACRCVDVVDSASFAHIFVALLALAAARRRK